MRAGQMPYCAICGRELDANTPCLGPMGATSPQRSAKSFQKTKRAADRFVVKVLLVFVVVLIVAFVVLVVMRG
jgi:hypothetical protein